MEVYQRIRAVREDKDKQQSEIARLLKTTQQQYSKYERGVQEMPIRHIAALARYYNLSLDYLACLIDESRPLYPNK